MGHPLSILTANRPNRPHQPNRPNRPNQLNGLNRFRVTAWAGLPLAILILLSTGCANTLSVKPQSPTVKVAGVSPINLSLTDTRLNFSLLVQNPNGFNLPVRNLDFDAFFAGKRIARGKSNQSVTIPANGEAIIDVGVSTGLSQILKHVKSMFDQQDFNLNYGVKGQVKLANWPAKIPFNVEGRLDEVAVPEGYLNGSSGDKAD